LLFVLSEHTDFVKALTVVPGPFPVLLSSSSDKTVRVWDLRDLTIGRRPRCCQVIKDHSRPVDCLSWVLNESLEVIVYTADSMGVIMKWELQAGRLIYRDPLKGHQAGVTSLEPLEDGLWSGEYDPPPVLTHCAASVDKSVRLTSFHGGSDLVLAHDTAVRSVLCVPSAMSARALVLTGGDDEEIRVWDIEREIPRLIATVRGHCGEVTRLAYWPGTAGRSSQVISTAFDGTLRRWSLDGE
jgi:WD40 repeat protein